MSFATAKVGGSSAGAFADYLSEQADLVAAYYTDGLTDGVAFPRVAGGAVGYLGVEMGLSMEQFEDLHHGRWNGRQLSQVSYRPIFETDDKGRFVRDVRGHKVPALDEHGKMKTTPYRNSWIDAVWAAPKSISEYMIATTPEVRQQIIAAWDASCLEGIRAIEDRAYLVRRTIPKTSVNHTKQQGSATERVRGAKLIVIPATQLAARHTEFTLERGSAPDPHLHTHNAISTLAFLPDPTHPKGMRPLTVDDAAIKRFGEEANSVVMGDFARRLEEMGIALDYTEFDGSRKGTVRWDVAGVSDEAKRFHSTNSMRRDAIIKQWENDYGKPPTPAQLNEALRKTRVSKKKTGLDKEADSAGVWDTWKQDLQDHGIKVPAMAPHIKERDVSEFARRNELHRRLMSTKGLTRDEADFTGDSIMNAVQYCAVGLNFTQNELKSYETELRDELIVTRQANDDRYTYFTTSAQITKEDRLERGRGLIGKQRVGAPPALLVRSIIKEQKHKLDASQTAAVFAATSGAWVHIEGVAGAGKSTTMAAVKETLDRANLIEETIVVSTASATAQRSGIKIGADRYGSVESIERQIKMGVIKPSSRTLWIIDEAAMMDTDRIDRLLMAARGQGRFVFVGDPAQLSPIGPGGWYAESVADHGSVMLDKTHRFSNPEDARDYARLRTGHLEDAQMAVANLYSRDRLHISEDKSERFSDLFEDYKRFRNEDKDLSADDLRVIVETSNQEVDAANLFIQSDRRARGEIKGDGLKVNDEEQGRSWTLHENDSILFLRSYLLGKKEGVIRNGTTGVIQDINYRKNRATVKLEDGRTCWVMLKDHERNQPIGLAYAQHANKIQGAEVPIVQVMPGTQHTANANSAYSQLTRAMDEAHVYLDRDTHGEDPKEAIAESWAKRVEKRTALSRRREFQPDVSKQHEPTARERSKVPVKEQTPKAEESLSFSDSAPQQQPSEPHRGPLREGLRHIRKNQDVDRGRGREAGASPLRHIREPEKEQEQCLEMDMGLDM